MTTARRGALEVGVALIVIVLPIVFVPLSAGPFVDPKLVIVLAGAAALWIARLPVDRRLAAAAAAWVAAMALSSVFGVDRWWSLAGPENAATGLLLLGASAFLLVAGASLPAGLADRLPRWTVVVGSVVALVAIAYRWAPGAFERPVPNLSFQGSTVGQITVLTGLMAGSLAAIAGLKAAGPRVLVPLTVVLTSGLSIAAERSGWVAAAFGVAIALRRSRSPKPRAILIAGTIVVTLGGWALADALVAPSGAVSAVSRFGELNSGSARARIDVLAAVGRGWTHRPILGWGPGNTWSAYLSSVTRSEVELAGRGWGDAHNIFAESLVTTGLVGLAAMLWLLWVSASGILRAPPQLGWASGIAAALVVNHLFQPLSVTLTPMLALFAGIAGAHPSSDAPPRPGLPDAAPTRHRPGLTRAIVGVLLAAGLAFSVAVLGASVLEQYGRTYNSEWALRASLSLAPGRVSAAQALATSLAVDGRSGDADAGREARRLSEDTVRLHPWNPAVRLFASDVERLLFNPDAARLWVERHLALFPVDAAFLFREELVQPPLPAPSPSPPE